MCEHVGRSSADHGALRTAMGELDARLDPATGWAAARDSLLSHFAAEERGETEVYGEHPRLLAAVDRVVTAAADPAAEAFGRGLHTHAAAEERSAR